MSELKDTIKQVIDNEPVALFMKGTPQFPMCGFSGQVVQILDHLGVANAQTRIVKAIEAT